MSLERLQKILARAGVASRRAAEAVVTAGRVRVNGRVVTELGTRADPYQDKIEVDGRRIVAEPRVIVLMHKPRSTVTTAHDPEGRPTVIDIVRNVPRRLYPVGRLDFQTSGALLLTNDGDLAAAMLHPKKHVPKTYLVKVAGRMEEADIERWHKGVELDDGRTLPANVHVVDRSEDATWMEVTLTEGRNQQIRRMGEATGFPVLRLTRLSFAGIGIDGLRPGQWRFLTNEELRDLNALCGAPKHLREIAAEHERLRDLQPMRPARVQPGQRPARHNDEPKRAADSVTRTASRTAAPDSTGRAQRAARATAGRTGAPRPHEGREIARTSRSSPATGRGKPTAPQRPHKTHR